jgi:hypothetical protein
MARGGRPKDDLIIKTTGTVGVTSLHFAATGER